jgi:phospholipid/cholesterol/gamma-HCH transport system substrate-binding protein
MSLLKKWQTVRWMEFSGLLVGAALAAVAILFLSVVILAMRAQGFGTEEYNIYCVFNKGLGLRVNTKVQVNGVEVGRVTALTLTDESKVLLTFTLKKDYKDWIVADAFVYATRDQNLISERIINIDPPPGMRKGSSSPLQEGDTIIAGQAQDIETVIAKAVALLESADTLAQKANVILNNALDPKSTLGALIMSRELYDQLLYQVDKVDQITTNTERMIGNIESRLPPLLDRADTLVGSVARVGDKLDTVAQEAIGILETMDTTMVTANQILVDLKTLTKGANELLIDGDAKVESASDLMTGIGSFWFIKNRIPQKDTVPLFGEEAW